MNKTRRLFCKKILVGASLLSYAPINTLLAANDYSLKNNPDQLKYQYGSNEVKSNPFKKTKAKPNTTSPSNNNINESLNRDESRLILPSEGSVNDFWSKPRMLRLKRMATGESANIVYYENGKINEEGYRLACYLLRDVKKNKTVAIDIRLLDLLSAVQAWLRYYGINEWIVITSGYRTKETNSALSNSAENSLHMKGKAIDFTVPGLRPEQIAVIAKQFVAGGIGIYAKKNFIHLDTGRVRSWRG